MIVFKIIHIGASFLQRKLTETNSNKVSLHVHNFKFGASFLQRKLTETYLRLIFIYIPIGRLLLTAQAD